MSIREYLIHSKYAQLQNFREWNNIEMDQFAGQKIEVKEQMYQMAEEELSQKFEQEFKIAKKENKKRFRAKLKDVKDELDQANEENKSKGIEIVELKYRPTVKLED